MRGSRIGVWSLRLDALYCALVGASLAAAAAPIGTATGLPSAPVVLVGVGVVAWAAVVLVLQHRLALRVALRVVLAANVLAVLALTAAAAMTGLGAAASGLLVVGLVAVAVDVAAFAASQGWALLRLRADAA